MCVSALLCIYEHIRNEWRCAKNVPYGVQYVHYDVQYVQNGVQVTVECLGVSVFISLVAWWKKLSLSLLVWDRILRYGVWWEYFKFSFTSLVTDVDDLNPNVCRRKCKFTLHSFSVIIILISIYIYFLHQKVLPEVTGKTSGIRKRKIVPWWSDKCKAAVKSRNKAFRKVKSNHSYTNFMHLSARKFENCIIRFWSKGNYICVVNSVGKPKVKSVDTSIRMINIIQINMTSSPLGFVRPARVYNTTKKDSLVVLGWPNV